MDTRRRSWPAADDVSEDRDADGTPSGLGERAVPWRWGTRERSWFTFAILAAILAKAIAYQAMAIRDGGGPYGVGDWLINYGGGFTRRGLFGQILFDLSPRGAGALWLLFAIQLLALALIVWYCIGFLRREAFSWPAVLIVTGPAALGFLAWDPRASFRKESLVLVAAVLLALARDSDRSKRSGTALMALAVGVFGLAVFSWEASALALPVLLYLLLGDGVRGDARRVRTVIALLLTVFGVVGMFLSVWSHGSNSIATDVCREIRDNGLNGPELCTGAVSALGWTLHRNITDVINAYPQYLIYWPLILLGFAPVLLTRWARREWRWALLSIVTIGSLFAVAIDYGRWTYLIAMGLAICVMAGRPGDVQWPRDWSRRPALGLIGVAYVTLWGLPVAASEGAWPFYSLIRDVLKVAMHVV